MPFIKIQGNVHAKRPSSAVGELCLNKLDFKNVYILLPGNFHARNLPLKKIGSFLQSLVYKNIQQNV